MEMTTPPAADAESPQENASLREDLRLLAADAKSFANAELAYQKTRAAYASGKAKTIAILGIVAAVFVFFALMAAIVGTVIALGPVLSPWGAMAAVAGVLLLLAGICLLLALQNMRRMKSVLSEGDSNGDVG